MKRLMCIMFPGWERFTGAQRASCIDFGLSVSLLLLLCCSESVLLALLGVANGVRSYVRLLSNGVEIDE